MKTDAEVHLRLRERKNGKTLEQDAARANLSAPSARKYLRSAKTCDVVTIIAYDPVNNGYTSHMTRAVDANRTISPYSVQ